MIHYCGDCAYRSYGNGKCPILKVAPEEEQTACPMFSTQLTICSICGNLILSGAIIDQEEDNYYYTCSNCCSSLGTCGTCKYATGCLFQTDTSCPEPQTVTKVIQQGNMRVQQQVMNPKRVEATCTKCPCFSTALGCRRADGASCELYKTNRKER